MKKLLKGAISTLLIGLMCVQMVGMSALAKEVPGFKLPVTIEQKGDIPNHAEELDVVLTAVETSFPMPEGSVDGKYIMSVTAGTTGHFPEISFPKLGVYEYTVHQEKGSISRCDYDDTVYQMRVYVTNAENGDGFESTTILYIDDINTKFADVEFVNKYDERKTREPEGTNPTIPTTAPTNPTTPTTIPSSELPVDVVEGVEEAYDPFGILGAYNENMPFGLLPATGTLWWAVPILVLGGILLMIVGRRRGHESEENEK